MCAICNFENNFLFVSYPSKILYYRKMETIWKLYQIQCIIWLYTERWFARDFHYLIMFVSIIKFLNHQIISLSLHTFWFWRVAYNCKNITCVAFRGYQIMTSSFYTLKSRIRSCLLKYAVIMLFINNNFLTASNFTVLNYNFNDGFHFRCNI